MRSNPALATFIAMGLPMFPRPMKPTRVAMDRPSFTECGMRSAECGIKHSLSGLHSRLFDIPQSSFRTRLETALREHERPSLTHCETLSVLGARSTTGTAAPSQAPPGAVAPPRLL